MNSSMWAQDVRTPRTGNDEAAVGQTVEWYTPPAIFEALGLDFDLDPCSPGADVVPWVPAKTHYTLDVGGLWQPWEGRVWLNPPYGPSAPDFIHRLLDHGDGIALLFSRTETQMFQQAAMAADAVCFLRDRVHFIRADGYQARSQMGSVLLAYGEDCAAAVRGCGLGWTP